MQGPTLTMSSVFNSNNTFPRSHSSTSIPDLVNVDYKGTTTQNENELPRSASFTTLPTVECGGDGDLHRLSAAASTPALPLPSLSPVEEIKSKPREEVEAKENEKEKEKEIVNPIKEKVSKSAGNKLKKQAPTTNTTERVGRRKSIVARPKSWIFKAKGTSPERPVVEPVISIPPVPQINTNPRPKSKSFASFSRKSWIASPKSQSQASSPIQEKPESTGKQAEQPHGQITTPHNLATCSTPDTSPDKSALKLDATSSVPLKSTDSPAKPPAARRASTLQRMRQRPQSALMNFTSLNSSNSSSISIPASSADNRSTPRTSTDKVPPLPKNFSTEKLNESPRRKDELWSAFRSLENDFSKFQSKSLSLKTNVVRSALLPFLRNHVNHPSNKTLRPEDIDRRINILNKWWMGLLEVLDGRQNQVVSGVDRPVLLDATVMIMTRPEWRLGPSQFSPLAERSPNRSPDRMSVRAKKSTSSMRSSGSQFLAESVFHNVRNLFIQNLTTQMTLVVSKMSLRHAPASLVTFCGKAAAYAFFFVPGIAEVLVRIWGLHPDTIKRVADELGLPRRPSKTETDEVAAAFPPHTRGLAWTSVKTITSQLRQDPVLSILVSKIPWYGPWIARWCGRDSDLFFVFAKHYHLLAEEFVTSDMTLSMKARAPGFVLVQAQLLTALDATIHRAPVGEPLPITFDDVLAGADASAAALPLPSTNTGRLMAENRLIMLLRDFLSERAVDFEPARITFAEAFGKTMQASAKRTSLFDHSACFVLCDFMEEAMSLFVRFCHAHSLQNDFIDWCFWLDVCKKMLESQNTMSEIRLFSLIYCSWGVITSNERRKEALCLDWLLTEDNFDKFFNHWCPMVRAYYMRLLCWRLCREDGEATDLDTKIYNTVASRIKTNWSHYLFLRQAADNSYLLPPSIAPCHPAPGRRLLIIRNDSQLPSPSLFLGFDGLMSTSVSTTPDAPPTGPHLSVQQKRQSVIANLTNEQKDNSKKPETPITPAKKRWNLLGKLLPFTSSSTSSSPDSSASNSPTSSGSTTPTKNLEEARKETAAARTKPVTHSKNSSTDETQPIKSNHRAYSFKFSLEWSQNFEKAQNILQKGAQGRGPLGGYNNAGQGDRRLPPPRLPAPAQAWLGARIPNVNKEITPRDPKLSGPQRLVRSKYAGRALAEWGLIIGECNNFVDRRRAEGVPTLRWVEVPTLGVDNFRKFGV